jgi:hypothetical protein
MLASHCCQLLPIDPKKWHRVGTVVIVEANEIVEKPGKSQFLALFLMF